MGIDGGPAGHGHTRRRLLGAAALTVSGGVLTAGCGIFDDDPRPAPAPDPLTPVLAGALTLAVSYDRAAVAQPALATRLTPLAAAHRAHAAELTRMIGTTPTPTTPTPSASSHADLAEADPPATLAELRAAERVAQKAAATACRQAPAARAALLGSIAAARASHVEALR